MKNILITGSNRGIGLELAKHYSKSGHNVIATCRIPQEAKELSNLQIEFPNIKIDKLDVTDLSQQDALLQKYKDTPIDLLINNAGVYPEHHQVISVSNTDAKWLKQAFDVNCVGSFNVLHNFKNNLLKASNPVVINMGSQAGSIAQTQAGFGYSYRISKAALNMLTKVFACECPEIITISIRPGWVKTYMGGENAVLGVKDCVHDMVKLIDSLEIRDSGKFLNLQHEEEKW